MSTGVRSIDCLWISERLLLVKGGFGLTLEECMQGHVDTCTSRDDIMVRPERDIVTALLRTRCFESLLNPGYPAIIAVVTVGCE